MYVGLKQPRGDGERYVTPARALAPSSKEGLALETSAFESLYGGQFALSSQLIKPNYLRDLYAFEASVVQLYEPLVNL